MKIEIEKGIEVPKKRGKIMSVISKMEIGDSIIVPWQTRNSLHSSFLRTFGKQSYTVRYLREEKGVRLYRAWRIK